MAKQSVDSIIVGSRFTPCKQPTRLNATSLILLATLELLPDFRDGTITFRVYEKSGNEWRHVLRG